MRGFVVLGVLKGSRVQGFWDFGLFLRGLGFGEFSGLRAGG